MALALAFNQERHLVAEEVMALHGVVPSGARSPLVFRINAPIAHGPIERALNEVIRRHSALRTAYGPNERYSRDDRWLQLQVFARSGVFVPGLYVQRVLSDVQLTVPVRTVAGTDELTELVRQELATPLDTTSGPPIRATLVDTGSAGTYLVLVLTHHTVDGWSLGVLAREFAAIIEAGADGTALPRVPMQYHDFAAWQLQQFRDGRFVREERFWHEQWDRLGDAQIAFTDLPFRRRTPVATVTAGTSYERLFFTPQESSQVSLLVSQLTLTPYALFRTAMTIALHYYTGKQRLAVWANFANRRYPEFMPTLGWYSNTHIVSVELEPDMSCASLCRRVAAGVAQAQAHEALPLPALWQRLGRSLDRHNTRVNFDVLPRRPQRTSPPPVEVVVLPVAPRNMDFDIRLREDGGVFALVATFSVGRYEPAAVQAFLASMRRIVTALAETPDLLVSDCRGLVALEDDLAFAECGSGCATCADPPDDSAANVGATSFVE